MLTFLFWNMGGPSPAGTAGEKRLKRDAALMAVGANLAELHAVDLFIVAECPVPADELLKKLNAKANMMGPGLFQSPDARSLCEKILIFPRFPTRFMRLKSESGRYTARFVRLPAKPTFTLFAAHLASKLHRSDESHALSVPPLSSEVRRLEKEMENDRTMIVGDLNINPFETGMVGAEGFNGAMTREVALREQRTVDGVRYPFFYNPMWSHFGDFSHELHPPDSPNHEPPGTCYFPAGESRWYYWNMYDQVLLRPSLLPYFRNQNLRIVISDGTTSLISEKGLPQAAALSDHLPLLFKLSL